MTKIPHIPTGTDITELLILCAPKPTLAELELSEDTRAELEALIDSWRNSKSSSESYSWFQILALALYYANRSILHFQNSASITRRLYIPPEAIYSLVQLSCVETFEDNHKVINGCLIDKIKHDKSVQARDAVNHRHAKTKEARDQRKQTIREIWATGKYSNRDICAEEEYSALGFTSFKSARNALKGTQDPIKL